MTNLKKKLSAKVVLALLSVLMLTGSIILYAASNTEIFESCSGFCVRYWVYNKLWTACMDGCMWAAFNL